jgi:endonuclease YncB( thermonuclease family)
MNSLTVTTRFIWFALGALAVLGFWYLQENMGERSTLNPPELINVIDGDTIVAEVNNKQETIRIVAIDTPEFKECYFKQSQVRLLELLKKQSFTLHTKPFENRDTHNRLLRYIEVNGQDVGSILIKEGFASHWDRDQHPLFHQYQQLEQEAKSAKQGRWGSC